MPVTKRVLMKAFCDECKAVITREADKGGVQEMMDYARAKGWRVGQGGYKCFCPECAGKVKTRIAW